MKMELTAFNSFLERCIVQTTTLSKIQTRYWLHGEADEHMVGSPSSLLSEEFLEEHVGRPK